MSTEHKKLHEFLKGLIDGVNPKSTVELGCGECGLTRHFVSTKCFRYGVDLQHERGTKASVNGFLDAFHNQDILGYLKSGAAYDIDVVMFIDSLEHMDKATAMDCLRIAEQSEYTKLIVIFIPEGPCHRGGENPLDHHKSTWTRKEFIDLGYEVEVFEHFHKPIGGDNALVVWKKLNKEE